MLETLKHVNHRKLCRCCYKTELLPLQQILKPNANSVIISLLIFTKPFCTSGHKQRTHLHSKKCYAFDGTSDGAHLYSNTKKKLYFTSQGKWPFLKIILIRSFLPPRVHAISKGQNVLFGTPPLPGPHSHRYKLFSSFYVRDLVSHPHKTNGTIKPVTCPIFRPLIRTHQRHFTLHTTLHSAHYTSLCTLHFTLHATLHSAHYTSLCTLHFILCILNNAFRPLLLPSSVRC